MSNDITPPENDNIIRVDVEDEMKKSYLDYAMSVIVSRALPDVKDGLKPVHRRILYAMHEGGYHWNKQYRKSARIVGDVMGNYHPHGDSAIYDAMVRMAQPFSMRVPLVDGQGNFGSMDGDPPAAMRYTEARLKHVAHELLEDIDKDTIDFQPNYDDTQKEPVVIPAKFPNLLVNGAGGIAVGMATNIPPHNLGEVIDACCALIDSPELEVTDLMQYIQGPDFPTGATIVGRKGIYDAFTTGRGSVVMRAKTHIEKFGNDRDRIVATEIPYQVNKAKMIERIAELVRDKTIEGISDIRDESDKDGVRVVIELKKDIQQEVILNQLYKYSSLQTSFGVNTLALDNGRPKLMNIKDVIQAFLVFRENVITRRTLFDLKKAQQRAHVLVGLAIAVSNLDPIIALIKKAPNPQQASIELQATPWNAVDIKPLIEIINDTQYKLDANDTYRLSEKQAKAILELKLHRLTGLEREKIAGELKEVVDMIQEYISILGSRQKILDIMKTELLDIKERYSTPRRSEISDVELDTDIEDLIPREDMVVTVTQNGYVKRVPLATYRAQRRGGKGRSGMSTRDEDIVNQVFVLNTHTAVLFFSSRGIVYKLKVFKLPLGSPTARGKAFINVLPLQEGETITTVMPLPEDESTYDELQIFFATEKGNVRRNQLSDFATVYANGKIAMKLNDGDKLIGVHACDEKNDILLATKSGKCIRCPVTDVRVFSGRSSTGVRGIRLKGDDIVISSSILQHNEITMEERDQYIRYANALRRQSEEVEIPQIQLEQDRIDTLQEQEEFLLTITENGFGKRSSTYEYRIAHRGGMGIANIETSKRNGDVIASFTVEESDQIVLITDQGKLIRCPINDVRIAGRNTQGVTLFKVADNEKVVSVSRLSDFEDDNDPEDEEGAEENAVNTESSQSEPESETTEVD